MVFNSYIFIFLFLPLAISGYFILNKFCYGKKGQPGLVWLLAMSLGFYAYDIPVFSGLLVMSIFVNYWIGNAFAKRKKADLKVRKGILFLGIVFNLAWLFYFKYAGFFVDSIEHFFHADWNVHAALPLGISFFTFMQIAYIVDCFREEEGFGYTLLEYAVYIAFFPKITMGPIAFHGEIIPQLGEESKKNINYDNLSQGLYIFALGLAKKVLLADTLAKIVNICYTEVYFLNSMTAIIVMFSYTLQLYFDFSGYCDMATGTAKMLNIELPVNFNSPYKAKSISEFWDRWHMTLTRFFTRYVYIPLGGSRKGKIRTYVNTMIVFLLSGLWHGADWGFVLWGAIHGAVMVLEKMKKDMGIGFKNLTGIPGKIADGVRWMMTFLILNITWVFFRAGSMDIVKEYFNRLLSGGWECQDYVTDIVNDLIEIRILKRFGLETLLEASMNVTVWAIIAVLVFVVVFMKNTQERMKQDKYNWKRGIVTVVLLVWCIISLSDVSEFLYFNF